MFTVQRTVVQEIEIEVEADDWMEAQRLALAEAGDHDSAGAEKDAEYSVPAAGTKLRDQGRTTVPKRRRR
jgi:hypothetical protein